MSAARVDVSEAQGAVESDRRVRIDGVRRVLTFMLAGGGLAYVVLFVVVAFQRMRYPFDLEWIEGGMVDEVRWVLDGHKIYVRPTIEFVPFIYNPLYFWVSALVSKIVGVGYLPLRLVSIVSTLGTFGLIHSFVARETKSRAIGIAAAGLYAATFKHTAQFMDLARVDALFVFLVLASIYVLRARSSRSSRILAAVLVVLAFLTKQSGMFVAAPLIAWALWFERKRAIPFALIVTVGIAGSILLLDRIHDGWYWYYAFQLPSQHEWVKSVWADFWVYDLMGPLAIALVGSAFALLAPSDLDRRTRFLYLASLLGLVVASYTARLHFGGWPNVLMPLIAWTCVLFGIALGHAFDLVARVDGIANRRRLFAFLALAGGAQLAVLGYDARRVVPKARDADAGHALIAKIAATKGEVFMPTSSHYPVLAGKKSYLHQMPVDDVLKANDFVAYELGDEIRRALRSKRFSLVITSNDFFDREVLQNYVQRDESFHDPMVAWPVAGVHLRPGGMFTPR